MKIKWDAVSVWILAPIVALVMWGLFAFLLIIILSGCWMLQDKKMETPPPVPKRTEAQEEGLRQNAGMIQVLASRAEERGVGPRTTESGTLKKAAEAQIATLGQPAQGVNVDDPKAISALLATMSRQEQAYREDRAAWEAKIDGLSRERDQYRTEVTSMGSALGSLKVWLFWGMVGLAVACFLCPGLIWVLVRFVGGRARAHVVSMVEGIQAFREEHKDLAPMLEAQLSRKMDLATKKLVKQIKLDKGI